MVKRRQRQRLRIVSWNVNGLRAAVGKGFFQWLDTGRAQVVAVQEVRASPEQLPELPAGWHGHFAHAQRKGYSGVGLLSRDTPDEVSSSLGVKSFDAEGRTLFVRFGRLLLVNCYFPNGNGNNRDNSRVPFKLRFYRRVFKVLDERMRRGDRILVMGDFNTAHQEIDLARPKQNRRTSGFLPEERRELDRWLNAGWVDTFRHLHARSGHYTWWSQRLGVRERNIGWRLDYVLASPGVMPYLRSARIHPEVTGSDHCPISVVLDGAATS